MFSTGYGERGDRVLGERSGVVVRAQTNGQTAAQIWIVVDDQDLFLVHKARLRQARRGSVKKNVLPLPVSLWTHTRPPWLAINCLQM